jgi:hypothetical protein
MKKNLLLLGAALLMTASAMAQSFTRTYTKASAPETTAPTANFFGTTEADGDAFYLWNVKYGGFYINYQYGGRDSGPYYQTRASVNLTVGSPVLFSRINPAGADVESGAEWDNDGNDDVYLLVSYVTKFSENRCTFAANWAAIWTDNNTETNRYFHIRKSGDYVTISPAKVNEVTVEWDTYNFCVRSEENDPDRVVYINMPQITETQTDPDTGEDVEVVTQEGFASPEDVGEEWAIVTADTYDSYIEVAKAQNELYQAALALRTEVELYTNNTTDYPGIASKFAEQYAAYNDAAATVESLQAAQAKIADIVKDYQIGRATPDAPVNFTVGMTNPGFDNGTTGWTGVQTVRVSCAENFNSNFDAHQDVTNLPKGVYRVSNQAFYRAGGHGANPEYDHYAANPQADRNALLYGRSKDYGEVSVKIKRAIDEANATSLYSNDSQLPTTASLEVDGYYIPNSMEGARVWFDAGHYQNQLFVGVSGPEDVLTIGFKKSTLIGNDWTIYDNFELWYYGETLAAYQLWGNEVAKTMPTFDWNEVYVGQPEKTAYQTVVTNLESASTIDDITSAISGASAAVEAVEASIEAYDKYVAEVDGFAEWAATQALDQSTDEFTKLAEYMEEYAEPGETYPNGSASYIIDYQNDVHAGTLNTEQILAEIEFIEEMKGAALGAGLFMGTDLSYLIKNPTFAQTASTGTGRANWEGTTTFTAVTVPEAEMFNKNFDIWQDINDDVIKPGLYEVSIKAFYRTASNGNAWAAFQADPQMTGDAMVHSYVYLNEFASPVKNVMEIAYDTNLANNCYARSDGKYTLDGMASAHAAFALTDESQNFTMKVYGLVTEDEAGHIRLGLRNETGTNDARWTLFGHFGIRYMDKSDVALKEVIEDYLTRYDKINFDEVGTVEVEALDAAYAETDGYEDIVGDVVVKDPNTGEEIGRNSQKLYDMLMKYVKAYNAVEESGVVYAQLTAKAAEVKQYALDHQFDMDESVYDEVTGVVGDVDDLANEGSKADFEQRIADLEAALEKAKANVADNTIDWDGELPIDATTVITNPEYEAGTNEGWSGTTPAFNYGVAEVFNNTFDIYQDIVVPKAGWYVVSVRAFDRIGDAANDYTVFTNKTAVAQAFQYVVVDGEETTHSLSQPSLFAVPADEQANFTQGASDSPGPWATVGTEGYAIPNNMGRAAEMFNFYKNDESNLDDDGFVIDPTAGYYYVGTAVYVAEPGTVRIGLRKESNAANSWCIWGDWKLWYYGDDLPTGIDELKNSNNLVAGPTQRSIYTLSGARVQGLQKGINIIKTVDAQGNVKTQKIFVK